MKNNSRPFLWIALGLGLLTVVFRSQANLSVAEARAYLAQGVKVVDVRTGPEFAAKNLTNLTAVINIPLDEVKTKFPAQFTNQSEVVLLHCRTGRRSELAEKELRELGYTNVFNLGSFEQAQKILTRATK